MPFAKDGSIGDCAPHRLVRFRAERHRQIYEISGLAHYRSRLAGDIFKSSGFRASPRFREPSMGSFSRCSFWVVRDVPARNRG